MAFRKCGYPDCGRMLRDDAAPVEFYCSDRCRTVYHRRLLDKEVEIRMPVRRIGLSITQAREALDVEVTSNFAKTSRRNDDARSEPHQRMDPGLNDPNDPRVRVAEHFLQQRREEQRRLDLR